MRWWIIICLIVLGTVVFFYRRIVVARGYLFVQLSKEFFEILGKLKSIEKNPEICNVEQAILTDHYTVTYYPGDDLRWTYFRLELVIANLEDIYGFIENKERMFRVDDWKKVQHNYKRLIDEKAHLEFLKWERGYKKIV